MSQYLDSLAIGSTIDIRGPSGRLKYIGHGEFSMKMLRKDPAYTFKVSKITMIAGKNSSSHILKKYSIIRIIVLITDESNINGN